MLAYVFWHWPKEDADASSYRRRVGRFHRALEAAAPSGFRGSRVFAVCDVPGIGRSGDVLEDWYFVDGFGDLGVLNEAAVARSSRSAHDDAASAAAGGAGGVYALRSPRVDAPSFAAWFGKPGGTTYAALFASLPPAIELWQRQMVLGPAPEFCALAHTAEDVERWTAGMGALARVSTVSRISEP